MLTIQNDKLIYRYDKEQMVVEAWGVDALRVRATCGAEILPDEDFALLMPPASSPKVDIDDRGGRIVNGHMRCEIDNWGVMSFYRDDKLLLQEYERNRYTPQQRDRCSALEIRSRMYAPVLGTENYRITARFEANDDEKLFGMGQYQQPQLNLKGCILELAHRNSQVSVPFVLSSRGYGMLWNNPAIGKATFGNNLTEWVAESTRQLDYWICCGDTPAQIEGKYTAVVGRAPQMPDFALGFWQSKLRYQTQEELLDVAREYHRRGIPVSVIVADYFHWPHQGDWCFDPEYWPEPEKMVQELNSLGMKLMVSIWPTVQRDSVNFREMLEKGYLVRSEMGSRMGHLGNACYFDVTNPEARHYMWDKIRQNYYDKGVRVFWLDEAEPEYTGYGYENIRYHIGADLEKGNLYPRCYAQMAWEGQKKEGQEEIINLVRCAWAGSQRYGALVWSGDVSSTFATLRNQLSAGLNMSLAGIPWWTNDIGGFHGGDIHDPGFIELMIRWFQFGTFLPVFRLHGCREPQKPPLSNHGGGACNSGAENEIWSYGDEACSIFAEHIFLREKMRAYLRHTMRQAHEEGQPVMRTMFYNYPDDTVAWDIDDQFFLGDDVLVCPVLEMGQRERCVYLPEGRWVNLWDQKVYEGGRRMTAAAPLQHIPVYIREQKWSQFA